MEAMPITYTMMTTSQNIRQGKHLLIESISSSHPVIEQLKKNNLCAMDCLFLTDSQRNLNLNKPQ
jgi:hypothetical protein